jgi:hypothetical protein
MSTLVEQVACMEREIEMCEKAYPILVRSKQITRAEADREIGILRDILTRLKAAAARVNKKETI